eukprot:72667_1
MSSPGNHTNQASQRWQLTNSLLDEGFSFLDASLAYRTVGNDPQKAIDFLNCRNIVSNTINVALSQRHNAVDQNDDTLHTEEVQEESQSKLSPNAINTITQHPMCLCGNVLRKCQVQYACMNGGNSVQCNLCQTHLNDAHELLYHCPTNKTPLYPSGYDLCLICAQKQIDDPQWFKTAQNRVIHTAQQYTHKEETKSVETDMIQRNDMYTNAPNIEDDFDDIYEHSDDDNLPEIFGHPDDEKQSQNVLHQPQKDTILQTAIALHQDIEAEIAISEVQHCDDTASDNEDEMLKAAIAMSKAEEDGDIIVSNDVNKVMDEDDSDWIYGFTDDEEEPKVNDVEEPMENEADAEVNIVSEPMQNDSDIKQKDEVNAIESEQKSVDDDNARIAGIASVQEYEWEWASHMQREWHPYSREINKQLNSLKNGEDMCVVIHGHWYSIQRNADNVATQKSLATDRMRNVRVKQFIV